MKVLFVNPDAPVTLLSLQHALRLENKKALLPPLGLLTVAAMLPAAWEKRLVDLTISSLTDQDLQWADYVFLGGMDVQRESVCRVIERCRNLGVKIVGGGPMFTDTPEAFDQVDHLILGEAEVTLPPFLADLEAGCPKHLYVPDRWADMAETPVPLWELVDPSQYGLACLQYSRGCPNPCDFCDVPERFGHRVRTKTAGQILMELEHLYALGWRREIFFVDNNFTGSNVKKETLPALIDWGRRRNHPFSFYTQVAIGIADDDELLDLLEQAGFECVFIGIETPRGDGLAECHKIQNINRDLVGSIRRIQRHGMQVQGGFIVGFDSDPPGVFDELIEFIQESGVVTAMVGLLYAPPGTRLYERLAQEKQLLAVEYNDNKDFAINFLPKMGLETLIAGHQRVLDTLYSCRSYYARIRTLFKHYRPSGRTKIAFEHRDGVAFLRALWLLGFRNKGRAAFWRLFFWSLCHPSCFRVAMVLAVSGLHYRYVVAESARTSSPVSPSVSAGAAVRVRQYGVVQAQPAL